MGLLPLVALVALDAVGMARAWATPMERVALLAGAAALHGACVLGALFVVRVLEGSPPRRWVLPLVGLPAIGIAALRLGALPAAQRQLGGWAIVSSGLLLLVAWLAAVRLAPRRRALVAVLVLLACANACAAPRMWPTLHLVAVLGVLGGTVALVARTATVRPAALVPWSVVSAAVAMLALRVTANVRFVARAQLPGAAPLLALVPGGGSHALEPRRPREAAAPEGSLADAHFVLVTVDALRADALGCYGAARATPNLDALAARGIRFARAYAQVPSTARSITSLLTATPPHALAAEPPTLPEVLRQEAWFTQAFYPDGLFFDGKRALARYAELRFGFAWTDTSTRDARGVTDAVIARVEALERDGEPRAFLWAHYFDPHEPYEPHGAITHGTDARARYEGEVAYVDAELGRLFTALARLRRPVVLVVTADHGEELGEHGGAYHGSSVYEEQVRVPLLLAAPGLGPDVVEDPVELIDVVPTVTSLLGVRMPGVGRDLLAHDAQPHDAHASVDTKHMLVRGRYKLVHDVHLDADELYDLVADPAERHNVFDRLPDVAAPLHAALELAFGLAPPQALERTLADRDAPAAKRVAAADELAARATGEGRDALVNALTDGDPSVARAATLALAELGDARARAHLVGLLDGDVSMRAAILLGRTGDPRALPILVSGIAREPDVERRRAAIHVVGAIGDAAAGRRLAEGIDDLRTRPERYLAIGRIAARHPEARLDELLLPRLADEAYDDARAHLVWALAIASTGRELPALVTLARTSTWPVVLEGIARSRAFPSALVGGVALGPGRERLDEGLRGCARRETATIRQWLGSSSCRMGTDALLHLSLPNAGPATLVVRARADHDAQLTLTLGAVVLGEISVGPSYREARLPLPSGLAERERGRLGIHADGAAEVELDFVLVVPTAPSPTRARYHAPHER